MSEVSIAIAIITGLALGWLMVRNNNVDFSKIHIINRNDFINNMRKGQLIDIRKKEDYQKDKIKGARNFKMSDLTSKYSKLRKDQSIYLYCSNGKKSKRAAKKLVRNNSSNIYILDGGIKAYNNFN